MNKQTIDIAENELKIVKSALKKLLPEDAKVFVFGSRATLTSKKTSDLDLAIELNNQILSLTLLAKLNEAFDESPLPFKVDIVDLNNISHEFKTLIDEEKILVSLT